MEFDNLSDDNEITSFDNNHENKDKSQTDFNCCFKFKKMGSVENFEIQQNFSNKVPELFALNLKEENDSINE